jgi:ATPase subunit of ABC transporter with duplicated ATPase domains
MILRAEINNKTVGGKTLFRGLSLSVNKNEKAAIIGRNGIGKTTLFNLLAGNNDDFDGVIDHRRGLRLVSTSQEHHISGNPTTLEYIYANLPDYQRMKQIIDTYPSHMGDNLTKIHTYSEALERFSELNYFNLEDNLLRALDDYQISEAMARGPFKNLSGGQKRFVDLVRVQFADADLALIDEPTNHMDYKAKAAFIDWLKDAPHACLVITHDRDVLAHVDRIIEIKDYQARSFKGHYDDYLRQNTQATTSQLQSYEVAQQTIANLKKQIDHARAMKPKWTGTADKKNPFVVMEERLTKKLEEVIRDNPKPSFWIDRESAAALNPKMTEKYHKYKERNIKLHNVKSNERSLKMLNLHEVVLGYAGPLFKPVTFGLSHGDRLQIAGRNGAGKTTLVKAIMSAAAGENAKTLISGSIECDRRLKMSVYEQEVDGEVLDLTLYNALEKFFDQSGQPYSRQTIMRFMGDYLFDPALDSRILVKDLSGGQKARLQLIKMLMPKPNLLILDEPTNHLDLPSIEELENALKNYHGAVLYVSHDSYFAKNVGGQKISLQTDR